MGQGLSPSTGALLTPTRSCRSALERWLRPLVLVYNRRRNLALAIRGADFACEGGLPDLRWLEGNIREHFEIKVDAMCPARVWQTI